MLEGKDIYAQDLHDILITLTDEDWDKGPAHINPKFDSVLALYQADRTPNAEIIDINPETHKFRATLVPLIPIENSEIRQKMLDAADTFNDEGGPNGPYAALVSEVDLLRKVALDETSAPVRLYDTCKRVKDRTLGKQDEGACPDKDVLVEDFVTQLEEAKSDVCLADARVRKKAESRAKDGMTLPDSAVAKELVEQMEPVAAESEGALEVELLEDANILADSNASVETRKDALYRIGSRIPRMISAARAATDEPAKLAVNIGKICAPGGGLYVLFKLLPSLF